jgi:glucan phosphoethanolaminetransferase (alkaline phosphatase superfamily)
MMMLELGLGEQASKKVHGLRICLWCAFLILFEVDSRRFFFRWVYLLFFWCGLYYSTCAFLYHLALMVPVRCLLRWFFFHEDDGGR